MQREFSLFTGMLAGNILWGAFQNNSIMVALIITITIITAKISRLIINNSIEKSEKTEN